MWFLVEIVLDLIENLNFGNHHYLMDLFLWVALKNQIGHRYYFVHFHLGMY